MKKKMQEENLLKMSEKADRSIADPAVANILLCYLLYRVDGPVEQELLYDVAVTGGIINYFTYQEALEEVKSLGSVETITNARGEQLLRLTPTGVECARRLKSIAARSYRDEIVLAVTRALRKQRNKRDVKISYEPLEQGCHLHVTLYDRALPLLELKLFTPDRKQAEALGERVLSNPSVLYHEVMQTVMRLEEEPIDLSDN